MHIQLSISLSHVHLMSWILASCVSILIRKNIFLQCTLKLHISTEQCPVFQRVTVDHTISRAHRRTLNFEVMLATIVPKGIKLEVFVRVDNVVVINLQDNCKF